MHIISAAAAMLAAALAAGEVCAQEVISLKAGESADLAGVYWIADCRSMLKGFAGVDVLDGPPGLALSIREQEVVARRQNCPNKVPGGVVVVTAREVPAKAAGLLKYRVRYETSDGPRQSTHSARIELYP